MHVFALLAAAFSLSSPAFDNGAYIPKQYTCKGQGISPPLSWSHVPRGTNALALRLVDLDWTAGPFTYWTLWNLPPSRQALAAGMRWPLVGRNSLGSIGYGAPCPPSTVPHHYLFRLYALKRPLRLRRGASPAQFARALRRNVIASAAFSGRLVRCNPPGTCG